MFEKTLGFEEVERGKRLGLSFSTALVLQLLLLAFLVLHSVVASPHLPPPILNLEMSFLEPPAFKPPAAAGGGATIKRKEAQKPKTQKEHENQLTAPPVVPATIDSKNSDGPTSTIAGNGGSNSGPGDPNGVDGGEPSGGNAFHAAKRKVLPPWKVSPPKLLKKVVPAYPVSARAMGLTGWVVLEVVVDENGRIESARVVKSSNPIFEKASLDAVKRWVYSRPTGDDGQRVACYMMIKLRFEL